MDQTAFIPSSRPLYRANIVDVLAGHGVIIFVVIYRVVVVPFDLLDFCLEPRVLVLRVREWPAYKIQTTRIRLYIWRPLINVGWA